MCTRSSGSWGCGPEHHLPYPHASTRPKRYQPRALCPLLTFEPPTSPSLNLRCGDFNGLRYWLSYGLTILLSHEARYMPYHFANMVRLWRAAASTPDRIPPGHPCLVAWNGRSDSVHPLCLVQNPSWFIGFYFTSLFICDTPKNNRRI
jgi:hypothetical protein